MRFENHEDLERARQRLIGRGSDSLASFLLTLALESGPIGEQIRTFIEAESVVEAARSIQLRLSDLVSSAPSKARRACGQDVVVRLDFIVDSIERLVLPTDARAAFELLVSVFEADAVALENCSEHDWEAASVFRRAAAAMAQAAKVLPQAQVEGRILRLLESNDYGVRDPLKSVLSARM